MTAALGLGWGSDAVAEADAVAGDLDASFAGGIVTTGFSGSGGAFAAALAIRSGQIVAVGGDGAGRYALGMYGLDGSLRFDRVTTNLGGVDTAGAVAITPGRGIVVAGGTDPLDDVFNPRFALARYFSFGALNPGFGGDGTVVTPVEDKAAANAVALQADGRIVAAGWRSERIFHPDLTVVRYNADGSLDRTFDGNGIRVVGFGRFGSEANAVAIQPDGKIVAAGRAGDFFAVARYEADGSLDTSFSGDGRAVHSIGSGPDRALALAIQPDGKILAAGRTAQGGGNVAIARYLPDGALDAGFGDAGRVITGLGGDEAASGIAIQADETRPGAGRIVIAGQTSTGGGRFLLARYHAEPFDDTPPDTTISGPRGTIADPEPSFRFRASEPGSTFQCDVDGAGFVPCSSPFAPPPLADGDHRVRARATDRAGNTDPTPAERRIRVDTVVTAPGDTPDTSPTTPSTPKPTQAPPVTGTPPPVATRDTTVSIRIVGRRLRLRKRRLVMRIACPRREASGPCRGTISIRTRGKVRFRGTRRRVVLATARYAIAAGDRGRVRARLGRRSRARRVVRLLRTSPRARRAATVARVRDRAGNRARTTRRQRVVAVSPARAASAGPAAAGPAGSARPR